MEEKKQKKFEVVVTVTQTFSKYYYIDAEDRKEAKKLAIELAIEEDAPKDFDPDAPKITAEIESEG
jgi:hypothetical protein